jgi:hypothetical protein
MKKAIYAILAVLPFSAFAQPTIQKAMDYSVGMKVKMVNSDHLAPGPAGANQTWDMSGLNSNDTTSFEYLAPTSSTPFPGTTIVEKSSDTTYQYYNKTNGGMYQVGMADSSTQGGGTQMKFPNSMLIVKNQLTFGLTATDTFTSITNFSGFNMTGKGTVTMHVDGYGTLKVPGKTYNNVIRVRVERIEKDTIPPPIGMSINVKMVSYMWFDTASAAPLCRVDSTEFDGNNDESAGYMVPKSGGTAVNDTKTFKADFTATFSQNQLVLNSNFNKAKQYEANLFNMNGQKMLSESFTPANNRQTLNINTEILPGIYIIHLQEKGNPASVSILKLAKQ